MKKISEVHYCCHRITYFNDPYFHGYTFMFAGFTVTKIINESTVTAIYCLWFRQDIEAKIQVLTFDLESSHLNVITLIIKLEIFKIKSTTMCTLESTTRWLTISSPNSSASIKGHH